ncbi:MAG: flagellar hook-basal body complex protein [Proteobacteria bacterium]|nr:flagellar hook-basal body complex protein [Pseudomonadota bacterium]
MISGIFASISGIISSFRRHGVTSNNVANIGTPGYKARRVVSRESQAVGVDSTQVLPINAQGTLFHTNRPLDLAINGDGFFQIMRDDGTVAYCRTCALTIDARRNLSTASGHRLVPPVTVPIDASQLLVSPGGEVRATVNGQAEGLGRIELARFMNPSGLVPLGDNLTAERASSGPPITGYPGTGGLGTLVQESLEGSKVDVATEFVMEILSSLEFKANLNALQAEDEMLGSILDIKT